MARQSVPNAVASGPARSDIPDHYSGTRRYRISVLTALPISPVHGGPVKDKLQQSYDTVAAAYAEHFRDELEHKPFDRKMLDWLLEKAGDGPLCDLGCGPGQVARYLHERGASVCGIDISEEMVRQAGALHPGITFQWGNMLNLADVSDNTYSGIAAFYSIIHIPKPRVVQALSELRRVLAPGGTLLITHH